MRKRIKIKFQNGITFQIATKEILNELVDEFDFIESDNPDFILFGPYGNDLPQKGNYLRIGYFCENILPDLSICDWAFGVPLEETINSIKYKRIQWHGLNPKTLIKLDDYNLQNIIDSKKHFCNFFYSNQIPYREEFFKMLNKYKKVDSPGKSMNNMKGVESYYTGSRWEVKRQFLNSYKFTIAFENYVYPGYQTEKLYDAMQCNSIPIYCGDPYINKVFNTKSFLNIFDHVDQTNSTGVEWLEKNSEMDFEDMRPAFLKTPKHRIKRFIKSKGRALKMKFQFNRQNFSDLIDQIIELDNNQDLYALKLKQPWFNNNTIPENLSSKSRWIEIFNSL